MFKISTLTEFWWQHPLSIWNVCTIWEGKNLNIQKEIKVIWHSFSPCSWSFNTCHKWNENRLLVIAMWYKQVANFHIKYTWYTYVYVNSVWILVAKWRDVYSEKCLVLQEIKKNIIRFEMCLNNGKRRFSS